MKTYVFRPNRSLFFLSVLIFTFIIAFAISDEFADIAPFYKEFMVRVTNVGVPFIGVSIFALILSIALGEIVEKTDDK